MPVETFWSNPATAPLAGQSAGDTQLQRYLEVPFADAPPWIGATITDGAGTPLIDELGNVIKVSLAGTEISEDAAAIFPLVSADGSDFFLSMPDNFSAPSQQEFINWHTAYQIEYLRSQVATTTVNAGAGDLEVHYARIGTDTLETNNVHALLSADGTSVLILNRLTPADIASLPLADQEALSALDVFQEILGQPYALEPGREYADAETARASLQTGIASVMEEILPGYDQMTAVREAFRTDSTTRGENWELFFVEQLQMLYDRLDRQAIFHPDNIASEVGAIKDRFDRLQSYRSTTVESSDPPLVYYVNSLDGGASLQGSINILLQTESRIYEAMALANDVAVTGLYEGRNVDAPILLTVMQRQAQIRAEAESEAEIEAMEQNNRLLEAYARMQELMNDTLGLFSGLDTDAKRGFLGKTLLDEIPQEYRSALFMFDQYTAQPGVNTLHPRERELGMSRPVVDMLNLSSYPDSIYLETLTKRQWDNFVIDLGEMTKLIGQDSQIRMDKISQINSEKNRHYDLATNTLNKVNTLLRMIVQY